MLLDSKRRSRSLGSRDLEECASFKTTYREATSLYPDYLGVSDLARLQTTTHLTFHNLSHGLLCVHFEITQLKKYPAASSADAGLNGQHTAV